MNQNDIFGTDGFIDPGDFLRLLTRLGLDLAFASIIVLVIYYRVYRNRDFVFTYYIFNLITFSMCLLLRKVPMELGFALGLFAVFGILRYRTEEIRIRDLTYLFIMIGIGIINGVANKKVSTAELLLVNSVIIGVSAILELPARARRHGSTPILYDNLALLHPDKREQLIADLAERTGFDVVRVQVHRIDFLRDAAEITIQHRGARPVAEPTLEANHAA
ncbi:MAG: DUF4956 domain-containing protein [Myxococcales bacterium]|nr:DUF4956 domain-containing protein [Myxococcales bacterium]